MVHSMEPKNAWASLSRRQLVAPMLTCEGRVRGCEPMGSCHVTDCDLTCGLGSRELSSAIMDDHVGHGI